MAATEGLTATCASVFGDPGVPELRERLNLGIVGYQLLSLRAEPPRDLQVFVPDASAHPLAVAPTTRNLRPWDGYGPNMAAVDSDTRLRVHEEMTRTRDRQQLKTRVFMAGPDLANGQPAPAVEDRLRYASDPAKNRREGATPLAELDYDRFDPVLQTVPVECVVPPWTWGGVPTRELTTSPAYARAAGFIFDGRSWVPGPGSRKTKPRPAARAARVRAAVATAAGP